MNVTHRFNLHITVLYILQAYKQATLFWPLCSNYTSFFFPVWFIFFQSLIHCPIFLTCNPVFGFILFILRPFSVSDVMDNFYSLTVCRFVPEVVSSGPAGGQLVPQFPVSREDNEVIQLHTGQQSTSAPYIYARHVVRRTQKNSSGLVSCTQTHRCPLLCRAEGKRKRNKALLFVHTHCS